MTTETKTRRARREPLSRERVVETAIRLADEGGIESLSMRKLADQLGVVPMATYYHFANKDDLLDAMVDAMYAEIDLPTEGADWKAAMRRQTSSVRAVLARHRWALGVMESRIQPGPANLRYHDTVIGALRHAGFSVAMAIHVFTLLDSYVFGFALQEQTLPFESTDRVGDVASAILSQVPADDYPNLAETVVEHVGKPGYDFGDEFEFGLGVILDGLERFREAA